MIDSVLTHHLRWAELLTRCVPNFLSAVGPLFCGTMTMASNINDTNWPYVDAIGPTPPPAENISGASVLRSSPSSSAPNTRSWSPRASRTASGEPACGSKLGIRSKKATGQEGWSTKARRPSAVALFGTLSVSCTPSRAFPPFACEGRARVMATCQPSSHEVSGPGRSCNEHP